MSAPTLVPASTGNQVESELSSRRSWRLDLGYRSASSRRRSAIVGFSAAVLAVVGFLASLAFGSTVLSFSEIVTALVPGATGPGVFAVQTLRLPRATAALAVGAAFAIAGALTQTATRNRLASPDIIGITSGASVGAVFVLITAGSYGGVSGLAALVGVPTAAVVGGLLSAIVISVVSRSSARIVLVGIGVSAAAQSATTWLLAAGNQDDAQRAKLWLTGSLNARTWTDVLPVLLALVVSIPLVVLLGRQLRTLALGDDMAHGLGVAPERTRWAAMGVATVLAALATAASGPIAFVGLIAPAVAARLTRSDRPPLAVSALIGAALVVSSDLIARSVLGLFGHPQVQLPVGVITGVLGGLYLLSLMRSSLMYRKGSR